MILLSIVSLLSLICGMYVFFLPQRKDSTKRFFDQATDEVEKVAKQWFYITSKLGAIMLLFLGFVAFTQAWNIYKDKSTGELRTNLESSVAFTLRDTQLTIVNKSVSSVTMDLSNCSNSNMTYLLYPELIPKDYSHIKAFKVHVALLPQKSQLVNVECTKGLCSNADTFITCSSVTTENENGNKVLKEVRFPLSVGSY